jgi:acetyl esterase/lipase
MAEPAAPLKSDAAQTRILVGPLVSAGYTVFAINHRAAPRFRYPAALEDAERAVRWIRASAARFGIAPDRIGAIGASSGGHLVSLLGVGRDLPTDDDASAIDRQSARVQAVIAMCTPSDLTGTFTTDPATAIASFLGASRFKSTASRADWGLYEQASPILRIKAGTAPFLLIHGDKDGLVPFEQSEKMEAALRKAEIPVKLIRLPGAGHAFAPRPEYPDFTGEMVRWFDVHLRGRKD